MEYSIIVIFFLVWEKIPRAITKQEAYQIIKDKRCGCTSIRMGRYSLFAFMNLNHAHLHSKLYLYLSPGMQFPTMWHFDCSLTVIDYSSLI